MAKITQSDGVPSTDIASISLYGEATLLTRITSSKVVAIPTPLQTLSGPTIETSPTELTE